MTISVGRKYHDYTAQLHYKAENDAYRGLMEYFMADPATIECVFSREHEDHENITDRHLQTWLRRTEEWTKKMDNDFGKNSRIGKNYLVPKKIPNVGEKSSKRWSQESSHWKLQEAVMYVFKDQNPLAYEDTHWWYKRNAAGEWELQRPDAVHYKYHEILEPKRRQARMERASRKTEPFNEKLMRLWRENGEPRDERSIFKMLCEQAMGEKWNYIEGRMILRGARYIYAKTNNPAFVQDMMTAYDNGDFF